uniref:EGF-like domain-containing protein n=1 Tax=Catharus ustulatus TaxID=91951 RepID=A0A8C3TV08_CATUS
VFGRVFMVEMLYTCEVAVYNQNDSRCLSNSCQKNSTCVAGHKDDPCLCADASVDSVEELCNKTSNSCSSNPCLQNATCLGSAGNLSFTCECPAGYNGPSCERADSGCESNPCEDLDECISEPCRNGPCLNGATCHDSLGSFSCSCARGFLGDLCDTDIDECSSQPCLHGGHCTDGPGGYVCQPGQLLLEPGFADGSATGACLACYSFPSRF